MKHLFKKCNRLRFVVLVLAVAASRFTFAADEPSSYADEFIDAVDRNDVKLVKDLIAENVAVVLQERSSDKTAPMHHVRSVEVAKILIEAGADVTQKDRGPTNSTPLRWAAARCERDSKSMLDVVHFLQSKNPCETDIFFYTAIGDTDSVKAIIEKDPAQMKVKNSDTDVLEAGTVIQLAAYCDQLEIIKLLLDHGADIHDRSGWSNTEALEKACYVGGTDVVAYLLDHGAKVDGPEDNDFKHSPLYNAAWKGRAEAVKLLLDHGAKVEPGLVTDVENAMKHGAPGPKSGSQKDYQQILDMLLKAH